jgi:hypothetical protein
MTPLPLPLALSEYPGFAELIAFQATGLVVVFLALGSIWAATELIGRFFSSRPAPAPAVPAPGPASVDAIDPATVVLIAAAVHATVGAPHRIHAITAADHPVDWAREGRRSHFASHQIR